MIPIVALMLLPASSFEVGQPAENTQAEIDYCSGQGSGQPFRLCLADQKHERAERELKPLLIKVRAAAISQRNAIAEFAKQTGSVTLEGDPATAFETSQELWKKSFAADCGAVGLSRATGNAGTEGVTAELECEADRTFERIAFLKRAYDIKD